MTTPLTDAQLAELDRMECAATPTPWSYNGEEDEIVETGFDAVSLFSTDQSSVVDIDLLIAARNSLRSLLDEIKASRAKIEDQQRRLEIVGDLVLKAAGKLHTQGLGEFAVEAMRAALAESKEEPKP